MITRRRYENLDGSQNRKKLAHLRQWRKERKAKIKDLSYRVPQAEQRQLDYLRSNRTQTTATWIGHSTFLLQMGGKNLITDPVWAERMGLEKRLAPPGLRLEELPPIDAVLLSHSHYDHMHLPTLRQLARVNAGMQLFVPAGLGAKLRSCGFAHVTEANWWEEFQLGSLELHFVPAQHWTRRTLFDMNTSHWGGWVVRPTNQGGERDAIYFAGDSGYFPGFKLIGDRFPIKWALMPIGAYEPEWFMSQQHVSPEQAVQAFLDCGAELFVPMHYGAFRLADDTPREALDRLLAEWTRRQLEPGRLRVLYHGETLRQ
ncbi:MBL fold metallo-hydrolase [Paenibacillus elgii]|uniref:MBL fold metallo-hydrolase n=1 Tax=Paenibacillus elgii TaxID=189691 RepID=UPI000FD7B5E9|nr:MBL fold metallo-hydrolase [Paenibacillus elgii]NEN85850.1 MBL fold metallo-hydrolase [Paenibacillus elgii]